jgi:hypothetical protein
MLVLMRFVPDMETSQWQSSLYLPFGADTDPYG